VGVADQSASRQLRVLHGPLGRAQFLRDRRERVEGAHPLQSDGENAAAVRPAPRAARGLGRGGKIRVVG